MQHDITSEEKKCSNRIYFFDFARHFQIVQGEELYLVILNFCSFLALNSQGETLPQICEKNLVRNSFIPEYFSINFDRLDSPQGRNEGENIYM